MKAFAISYKTGPIDEQVLKLTDGRGVDCVIIAGGGRRPSDRPSSASSPAGASAL